MFSIIFLGFFVFSTTVFGVSPESQARQYSSDSDCKDTSPHCRYWFLNNPKFDCGIYGPSICKKFCGYCSSIVCRDRPGKEYYCRIYKRKGKCRTDYANRNCRRTCKKC